MDILKCHKKHSSQHSSHPTKITSHSPCTLESLNKILTHIKPSYNAHIKNYFSERFCGDDYNEVFPNIYIGNYSIAKNKKELCKLSVSYVLNCAEPSPVHQYLGCVNTSQVFYDDVGITYMGLQIDDTWNFPLVNFLERGSKFIDSALQSKGKILVNCMMGMSRSTSIVLGYLMKYQGMTIDQALTAIRKKREVHPNIGFLQQLIAYDSELRKRRK
ncbi:unnamed protein product [Gordionus sp. m RMFG-2023]|uniref:dual specificity protein phosphatase 3-like n=1 Tax=Gordionus sp. m RMFG-2023 TaxID=3053472 RepID=UPI0030E12DFF